jgi:hypothetical protein
MFLITFLTLRKPSMYAIGLTDKPQPVHRLKHCYKCDTTKPPEGGIDMGHKWMCQACWIFKTTGGQLKQYNKRLV